MEKLYVDDCFIFWKCSWGDINELHNLLQNLHPKKIYYGTQLKRTTMFHHHHVVPVAQISLNLSRHSSLSFIALGRSSGLHPVSSHSCSMYVRAGRPAFTRPYVGVHGSTSLLSSSMLLQQSCVPGSSNLDSFRDGRQVAV